MPNKEKMLEQKPNSSTNDAATSVSPACTKPNVVRRLSNKDLLLIKEKILHCLADDFKGNQAIFDRKEGWQVFNGTDLSMVMDSVVKGLKFSQNELNTNNEK